MSYRPRRVEFRGRASINDWTLKRYAITAPGCTVEPELFVYALSVAERVLPSPAAAPGRSGVGFVVVHETDERTYVLVCWWPVRRAICS
jgi:hypothetical protein